MIIVLFADVLSDKLNHSSHVNLLDTHCKLSARKITEKTSLSYNFQSIRKRKVLLKREGLAIALIILLTG